MTQVTKVFRFLVAAVLLAAPSGLFASELTVFAAASLKEALDDVATDFGEKTGMTVSISYAGSSILARQIRFGAPADVFISANPEWMDELTGVGAIIPDSRTTLLSNRLVLIAHHTDQTEIRLSDPSSVMSALGDGKLAMAIVDAVPAGIYGKQALMHLSLWDKVAPNVAQTDNVRAALALVALQAAPLGVVYTTDALADGAVVIKAEFPLDSHPEITYPAAAIRGARQPQAQRFLDYLQGEEAENTFKRYGFLAPAKR